MILRDLLARLGLQVDPKGFRQADRSIEGVATSLRTLVAGLAAVAGAAGFGKLIGLASDANETLNVLSASFGQNTDDVIEWAGTTAKEVGRSEFRLREMAGTLGALLNPLMEGNSEAAAEMSKGLAALAVDLGSFFNATDDEALIALRAGISGESEPLKRFGVVLTEAALQQQALNEGIGKSVKSMTIAEKTALRYRTILAFTQAAQGDAAKTSEGFANASKALGDALRDLGTRIGLSALPTVEKLIRRARDMVGGFAEVVRTSNLAEGALGAVAIAAAIAGVALVRPFLPALGVFLKTAIGVGLLALVIDDILTLFRGGRSVIGLFIDEIFGLGAADEFVENHRAGVELMAEAWRDAEGDIGAFFASLAGFEGDLQDFAGFLEEVGIQLAELTQGVVDFVAALPDRLVAAVGDVLGIRTKAADRLADREFSRGDQRQLGRGVDAGQTAVTGFQQRALARREALTQRREQRRLRRLAREAGADVEGLTVEGSGRAAGRGIAAPETRRRFGVAGREVVLTRQQALGQRTAEAVGRSGAFSGDRARTVVEGDDVNITIQGGGDNADLERRLRQVMEERDRAKRRKAASALSQAAEG